MYLDTVATSFSLEALLSAMSAFVDWLFNASTGAVATVLNFITSNQILWVFLALALCTLAIGVLARIRKIF